MNTSQTIYNQARGNGTWYLNYATVMKLRKHHKLQQDTLKDSYKQLHKADPSNAAQHEEDWRHMSHKLDKFYQQQVGWFGQSAWSAASSAAQGFAQQVEGTVSSSCSNIWNDAQNVASGASALGQAIWNNRSALESEFQALQANLSAAEGLGYNGAQCFRSVRSFVQQCYTLISTGIATEGVSVATYAVANVNNILHDLENVASSV